MSLITDIFLLLLFNFLAGSLSFGVWYLLKNALYPRGYVRIIYSLLKAVIIAYLLPFVYIALKIQQKYVSGISSMVFASSPVIQKEIAFCMIIWLLGLIYFGSRRGKKQFEFYLQRKACFPAEVAVQERFDKLAEKLGIRKEIRVKMGYSLSSPFIYGSIKSVIYIPVKKYSEKEWDVISTHEMIHAKNKDMLWKSLANLSIYIFWFLPFAKKLFEYMDCWAEANCDYECCRSFNATKEYFYIIDKMAAESANEIQLFAPMCVESKNTLEWRIESMKKNPIRKIVNKRITWLAFMLFILGSNISVLAATTVIQQAYTYTYWRTNSEIVEELQMDEQDEIWGDVSEFEEWIVEDGEVAGQENSRSFVSFSWTVPNKTILRSATFSKKSGDTIVISVEAVPSNKTISIGIVQPDGSTRKVNGKGAFGHNFALTKSGSYRIFVENKSGISVKVEGNYNK